jgi:hypothetical protein
MIAADIFAALMLVFFLPFAIEAAWNLVRLRPCDEAALAGLVVVVALLWAWFW